jgi:hypothetical protein
MARFLDHPRVALVLGLLLGGAGFVAQQFNVWAAAWVCWGLAVLVVLWTALTTEPVRRRSQSAVALIPFRVHIAWVGNRKAPRVEVEKGFLDFEKGHLEATKAATRTLQAFGAEMKRNNPKVVAQAARMQQLQGAPVDQKLDAANDAARLLERHAARIEGLEKTYRAQTATMTLNLVKMVATSPATGSLGEFPEVLATTAAQTMASTSTMAAYRDSVVQMRQIRVSQTLNRSCDQLVAALDRFLEDSASILKAYSEAQKVIAQRWPKPLQPAGQSTSST